MYEYDDEKKNEEMRQTVPNPPVPVEQKKKKEKKSKKKSGAGKKFLTVIAYALVFGLVAGAAFQGVSIGSKVIQREMGLDKNEVVVKEQESKTNLTKGEDSTSKAEVEVNKKTPQVAQLNVGNGLDVSTVAANVMPSIVSITNKSVQEVRSMFGRGIREYESTSCGSGIIIGQNDEELLIVTNNHVIESASALSVGFINEEVCEAVVKGSDSENDLAVIAVNLDSINEETMSKISVAAMGDSNALVIGQQVVAIGNALGYGQSVTTGIISALDREVELENICSKLIQTDAAINPGNSGGALLNMKGEVVGINSAKFASSEVEGMGYAIPISIATPIIEELMNRETRTLVDDKKASYIGIAGISVTSEVSESYDIPEGIYISETTEGGPAEKAGILKGDIIQKFDGISVASMEALKEQLQYYEAGETVDILIKRADGNTYIDKTIAITLGKKSESELADEEDKETDTDRSSGYDDSDDEAGDDFSFGFGDDYGSIFGFDPYSFFGF